MDEKTLLQLYRSCYPDIARYIMNRNGSAEQAEEAFHAALAALLQQLEKGAEIQDFGAYLFRSAWYAFLAERKHVSRYEQTPDADPQNATANHAANSGGDLSVASLDDEFTREPAESGPGPDHLADQKILLEAAEACIAELTPGQQRILELTFDPELNLDDDEIATRLGVNKDYVRVARFRAMEALRARMHKRGFGYMMG